MALLQSQVNTDEREIRGDYVDAVTHQNPQRTTHLIVYHLSHCCYDIIFQKYKHYVLVNTALSAAKPIFACFYLQLIWLPMMQLCMSVSIENPL